MHIGILSFRPLNLPFTEEELRLREEGEALGYELSIFRSAHCQILFDETGGALLYEGEMFPDLDVLIPRVRLIDNIELRAAFLRQFELQGLPLVNCYHPISYAKNKLRTQQILHEQGIPTPRTVVLEHHAVLELAIQKVGGAPIIVKDAFGTFGTGVVLAESFRAARSILDSIWKGGWLPHSTLIQEYIEEAGGRDMRVFVIGGKAVAAMERVAQGEEFRSNIELGGKAHAIELTQECADLAVSATQAMNLEVAGVDIIQSDRGPLVLEVNCNPGFKALEEATGINVAKAIIEHAVYLAKA